MDRKLTVARIAKRLQRELHMLVWRSFRVPYGEMLIRRQYRKLSGKNLNYSDPKTFSEKLHCRMIDVNRYGNPLFTYCADKILVRNYVARATSSKYLNKIFWSGADPRKIPFDELPERCILKSNHGSGQNMMFEVGVSPSNVVAFFIRSLSRNYYWASKEFHYYSIKRKVFAEEILSDGFKKGPIVYSFWIFDGSYFIIQIDNVDRSINTFYDKDWNKLDIKSRGNFPDFEIDRPENLAEMIEFATRLGKDFDFVRVDMYNVSGNIYFSELTFHPGGAAFKFTPPEWEYFLGEKWNYRREANIRRKAPDNSPLEER